jgi:hypothetical protein
MVQKLEERPPFVRFEVRAEEDRAASLEAGHYVGRDVHYALITPMGSKDCIERKADEWFEKLRGDVAEGRCPKEWFNGFREAYKDWCEGRETPISGTPITDWPPASPAQVKSLLSLHIRTVEDLASANEEVLGRLGMGGRALKQRAVDWLASASSSGKVSADLTALRAANENLTARNQQLEQQLKDLSAKVEALATPSGGSRKL